MKAFRLHRLFHAASRRGLVLAAGPGIGDPGRSVRALAAAAPDALQLSLGQAALLQSIPGKDRPALLVRADVANVHGHALPATLFSRIVANAVEQAVRLDAAGVVVGLIHLPGEPALIAQCVENIARLRPGCERFAMPLVIEVRELFSSPPRGGEMTDGDVEKILPLVRQARELGADIIETDAPGEAGDFQRVLESAGGVPVLVRTGGTAPDAEILARAESFIRQGAAGLVCGGDFFQHPDSATLTRALMAVVHDGATAADAGHFIG